MIWLWFRLLCAIVSKVRLSASSAHQTIWRQRWSFVLGTLTQWTGGCSGSSATRWQELCMMKSSHAGTLGCRCRAASTQAESQMETYDKARPRVLQGFCAPLAGVRLILILYKHCVGRWEIRREPYTGEHSGHAYQRVTEGVKTVRGSPRRSN